MIQYFSSRYEDWLTKSLGVRFLMNVKNQIPHFFFYSYEPYHFIIALHSLSLLKLLVKIIFCHLSTCSAKDYHKLFSYVIRCIRLYIFPSICKISVEFSKLISSLRDLEISPVSLSHFHFNIFNWCSSLIFHASIGTSVSSSL